MTLAVTEFEEGLCPGGGEHSIFFGGYVLYGSLKVGFTEQVFSLKKTRALGTNFRQNYSSD